MNKSRGPAQPQSEEVFVAKPFAEKTTNELAEAEMHAIHRVSTGISFWFASLKAYQEIVDHWVQSREAALTKSLVLFQEIAKDSNNEKKLERTADVIVDQMASFQRDLLTAQLKSVAQLEVFASRAKPEDIARGFGNLTPDQFDPRKKY
jgi:hypothetical protein